MKWFKKLFKSAPDTRVRIEMINPYTSLQEVMCLNEHVLTVAIVEKIMEAVDNDMDRVDVAIITHNGKEYYNIGYSSAVYLDILEAHYDKLISFEEYHLLIEVNNYINNLKKSINIFGEVN